MTTVLDDKPVVAHVDSAKIDNATTHDHPEELRNLLCPSDCYDANGQYWADASFKQRVKFSINSYDGEAKREGRVIWSMFKHDPLSPVVWWIKNCVVPGAGIGLEGYVLFSIGNIKPLLEAAYPSCWAEYETCSKQWIQATEYLTIIGIISGQLMVGYIGDNIGRRWGLIQDICLMFTALVLLTSAWASTYNGWVIFYGWSLFLYGIGVGGEYPMTATASMEKIAPTSAGQKSDRMHRGRNLVSAFMMQGLGAFSNQLVLIVLLLIFNDTRGKRPYARQAVQLTYRGSFLLAALGSLCLVYYRIFRMKFSKPRQGKNGEASPASGYNKESIGLIFRNYGSRLFATTSIWFCSDLFWFGNKLFQDKFIQVLTPGNTSVMTGWKWNLVNTWVTFCGYVAACFLIDHKLYGRRRMIVIGFSAIFILFVMPAFAYNYFTSKKGVHLFMACYFMSGFFAPFGPNCVIFLAAAEIFPRSIRATAHGISAAAGKAGALTAAVLFNFIDTRTKFWFIPWVGLVGAIISFVFLPDTTGLDLKEGERRWEYIGAGRADEYCGVAVHRKHLSLWERWRGAGGGGKLYNGERDYKMRTEELGTEWERAQHVNDADRSEEQMTMAHEWHEEIHEYFRRTRSGNTSGSSSTNQEKI